MSQGETVVFAIHAFKQFSFGFEVLQSQAQEGAAGSSAAAIDLSAIYQYLAFFYLIGT